MPTTTTVRAVVSDECQLADEALNALATFLLDFGHLMDDVAPDADRQEGRQRSIEAAEHERDQAGI